MATVPHIVLGPHDHGRPISYEEFLASDSQAGYHCELIDGKVYVSPQPNIPHAMLELWLYTKLAGYSSQRSDIINFVYFKTRVFVPGRKLVTCPEPDISAYSDFPHDA